MASSLHQVVAELQRIAPLEYAADWDNVGLLVEPTRPREVERLLLAVDLTEAVFDEALERAAQLVVAYHPPIFGGLKRVTQRGAGERTVARALESGVAIYSPHTALDAAPGGVNDWLAGGVGPGRATPLERGREAPLVRPYTVTLMARGAAGLREALREAEREGAAIEVMESSLAAGADRTGAGDEWGCFELICDTAGWLRLRAALDAQEGELRWRVQRLESMAAPGVGQGRRVELREPVVLPALVERLKGYLRLPYVRVASSPRHARGEPVRDVVLCPGAGGSVLVGRAADVYLTGEMRHHDVLAATERGTSVILTDHTHTERGYLPRLAELLREALPGLDALVSHADAEPLRVV